MKLKQYIEEHHNGNTSSFARSQHVSESQARRWLKRRCLVVEGVVYCEISKSKGKDRATQEYADLFCGGDFNKAVQILKGESE